jgi:hypothetical protein
MKSENKRKVSKPKGSKQKDVVVVKIDPISLIKIQTYTPSLKK